MVLTMVYNLQNYWVSRFCPPSTIFVTVYFLVTSLRLSLMSGACITLVMFIRQGLSND
jgi:hypothetical protein